MTFNDNADISGGKVSSGGRNKLILGGGGGGIAVIIVLFVVSQLTGVDVTGLVGGTGTDSGSSSDGTSAESLSQCTTGAQANSDLDCRMKGAAAALDVYWTAETPTLGAAYHSPGFQLFTDSTQTSCGAASSATGPFYCPGDEILYVDTTFFNELKNTYGSSGGPLAQMYVVAHEWGHHIQKLQGTIDRAQQGGTGSASQSVRVELQADCYAGAWVGSASTVPDANGVPFLKAVTQDEIADALSAASAVGDDSIQAKSGTVNPETFTHGTSAQRQKWFMSGYSGGATSCDTFSPSASSL